MGSPPWTGLYQLATLQLASLQLASLQLATLQLAREQAVPGVAAATRRFGITSSPDVYSVLIQLIQWLHHQVALALAPWIIRFRVFPPSLWAGESAPAAADSQKASRGFPPEPEKSCTLRSFFPPATDFSSFQCLLKRASLQAPLPFEGFWSR